MDKYRWRRQTHAYHDVIGWWHVPDLYARLALGGTFHVLQTNAVGMRSSRDYPRKQPPGRKRLLFLGDSYTAGDGVSNCQRFTDLLEARFPGLDAMNFGLNGSGTDQQLLVFETLANGYEADAYVFCPCVENIARNMYTCFPSYSFREQLVVYRPKPYFDLIDGSLAVRNQPVPREKRSADELGNWRYGFPYRPGESDRYAIYGDADSDHWQLMKAILMRFCAQVRGKPVLIAPLPVYDHYLVRLPPTYMERFAELDHSQDRVHVIDLLPAFIRRPLYERKTFLFAGDPHYTHAAHRIVADELEYNLSRFCPGLLE